MQQVTESMKEYDPTAAVTKRLLFDPRTALEIAKVKDGSGVIIQHLSTGFSIVKEATALLVNKFSTGATWKSNCRPPEKTGKGSACGLLNKLEKIVIANVLGPFVNAAVSPKDSCLLNHFFFGSLIVE
ncbi:hypothetical protein HDV00_010373 [Rhizophlyctis rosea]|nr:hypothetical protein HDV00_010373 [Rhizophlyctis rosea]